MARRRGKEANADTGAQFVRYFGPVLDALRALGGSGSPAEVMERVAKDLSLDDSIQNELLPSGEPRFRNQVHWARFYLVQEGLIHSSKRGVWNLTDAGARTTLTFPQAHDLFLKWVDIFRQRREAKGRSPADAELGPANVAEPPETSYRSALLERILALSAPGFERLAQRVLRESGFSEVVITGRSGDGGIDGWGTLYLNPIVSLKVVFQCKKWKSSVSSPAIRDFRGGMDGRADKGLFITTGNFTKDARNEAARDGAMPIELVDGEKLIDMMRDLELGLRPIQTYEVEESFFLQFDDT